MSNQQLTSYKGDCCLDGMALPTFTNLDPVMICGVTYGSPRQTTHIIETKPS